MIKICVWRSGHEIVVVLGHPGFYAKFGLLPAKPLKLHCEFETPDDVFRVIELSIYKIHLQCWWYRLVMLVP